MGETGGGAMATETEDGDAHAGSARKRRALPGSVNLSC